jgi:hypothetical protein
MFTYLDAQPLENVASCLLLRGGLIAKEHVIQHVQCYTTTHSATLSSTTVRTLKPAYEGFSVTLH